MPPPTTATFNARDSNQSPSRPPPRACRRRRGRPPPPPSTRVTPLSRLPGLDHHAHALGIRLRRHAVAEVEHVPRPAPLRKDVLDARAQDIGLEEQRTRIQVPL